MWLIAGGTGVTIRDDTLVGGDGVMTMTNGYLLVCGPLGLNEAKCRR